MQLETFTLKAQEALAAAQQLAVGRGNAEVEPEHLMVSLLEQEGGLTVPILERIGANPRTVRADLDGRLSRLSTVRGTQVRMSRQLRETLDDAQEQARQMRDTYTSTEHVLMSLSDQSGWTAELLQRHGVTRDAILAVLRDLRGTQRAEGPTPRARTRPWSDSAAP